MIGIHDFKQKILVFKDSFAKTMVSSKLKIINYGFIQNHSFRYSLTYVTV